jgi:hypothetical protein
MFTINQTNIKTKKSTAMPVYNQLSSDYDKLFLDNLNQFQKGWLKDENPIKKFDFFYPSFGVKKNEKCDFLIYGQAANGWGSKFVTSETKLTKSNVKEGIEYSNDCFSEREHTPLDWVNVYWSKNTYKDAIKNSDTAKKFYPKLKYSVNRSFFWNVVYKLISDYYGLDKEKGDWSKKMVWSNLYKIAPYQKNPGYDVQELQRKVSIELVKKELEELTPKYCIVMTNEPWWKPFREKLKTSPVKHNNHPQVISVEQYKESKIILTTRPFSGSSDKHVEQILKITGKELTSATL